MLILLVLVVEIYKPATITMEIATQFNALGIPHIQMATIPIQEIHGHKLTKQLGSLHIQMATHQKEILGICYDANMGMVIVATVAQIPMVIIFQGIVQKLSVVINLYKILITMFCVMRYY